MLICDDVELGMGLARIAMLSFRLGDMISTHQFRVDAEDCYVRAERFCVGISPDEQEAAESKLKELRRSIVEISKTGDCTDLDLGAERPFAF